MTTPPLPYFFAEAELASNAKQPGDREKALNFSLDDLKWLKTVYLPTDKARTAATNPMHVDRLLLTVEDKPDIPLAGAFTMSRPDDAEVTLYTPWKGLIKYADMDDLKDKLKDWLKHATAKRELLGYLSVEQRSAVLAGAAPDIATTTIEGAVFQDQELILELNQADNIKTMLGELVKIPSLQSMLDESLKMALAKRFPALDQRLTRLELSIGTVSAVDNGDYQHTLASLSLSDALLHFYLANQWPPGDSRSFSNPQHRVGSDADNQAWESAIIEIAQSFTPHLRSLLKTFWNTPMSNGLSRSEFFCHCLRDTFHLDLLLKRQQGILTSQEYLRLVIVSLVGTHSWRPQTDPLRIEKVRVSALYKHYAELACTLMIGSTDTLGYLYTQSRGIEAANDLPAINKIVLEMLKSEGHEDMLLNFMSLEERNTFLSLEPKERVMLGEPIIGPVFEQLMADILAKQLQNLTYALERYRESEGTLNPYALVDKALDVRGLIDDRLLVDDAGGRWSTQADQRWSAQPATVRAESAKTQLAMLDTVEQALEQRLEEIPAIPPTTRTVTEANSLVGAALEGLQSVFTHTLSTALRSECKLRAVAHKFDATEQDIINTVLDSPVRLQRAALNGFLPDVFTLALKSANSADVLKLASCFVVTERGGLDLQHSGKAILWTPALGFEGFPALTPLLTELERRLGEHDERPLLLENLGPVKPMPGQPLSLAPLERVHEHFLDQVQKPFIQLDQSCVERALGATLPAPTLSSLLHLMALHTPKTGLDCATNIARSLTTQQKLPAWLAKASIADQVQHAELLQQYLNNVENDQDYLSGVISLARTTQADLHRQLKADAFDIDPDHVQVQVDRRMMSPASRQTLTEFALSHFHDLEPASLKLLALGTTAIPEGMNETYIKDLIRNLKAGERYATILTAAFADTSAHVAARKQRFASQLPWQMMHYAHTEKLQEHLSATGFDLIRQVMDMPDATARAAVDEADAIIRPLEFMGIKHGQTIKVPGVYLIGSTGNSAGPFILVAPYSPRHGLKEYENEQQLLTELKTRGALHDWVLMNVPQPDRILLEDRMATTSKQAAEVNLASSPIKTNLFGHLLNDNVALLTRLLGCQSDDRAQGEWATIKHVLSEDLQQAFTFLTGKLAYPITVWRSYRDIKQSAEDLQTHKWGSAIKAFISGIAQLASLRQSIEGHIAPTVPMTPGPRLKWHDIDITAPERIRLKRHERSDVDLGSLTLESALGLYTHPTTKNHYAAVEGKVYPVEKKGTRWRTSGNKTSGAYLRQNTSKQWVLDSKAPRYGMIKRYKTSLTVNHGMHVEATGMQEIRALFPVKARLIEEGLDLATTYAWNSFRNLALLKSTGNQVTPVHQLIMDFIDVPAVLPAHAAMLETVVGDIFTALLDATLRQPKSKRFVVGKVREDHEHTFAFTVASDKQRKIYLGERFFLPQFDHYRNYMSDAAFPISAHARAATLIHELSHVVCNTEDISYLDSGRPFVDLIETTSKTARELKAALTDLQDKALSSQSPLPQLFAIYDPASGLWEDLGDTSYEDSDRANERILAMTGEKTLADARKRFKNEPLVRLKVQLANADSVSWLITHLGRQLHTSTP